MANLNNHDLLILNADEFKGFKEYLEQQYEFSIQAVEYPKYVSLTSKKVILKTNIGNYFLKEKPDYCSDEISLKKSALFQDYLSQKMSVVPSIKKTLSNEAYLKWNDRYYFLSKLHNGRGYNGSDSDIIAMIVALKDLNELGKLYLKSDQNVDKNITKQYESYEVAKLIPLIKNYVVNSNDDTIYENILSTIRLLTDQYKKVESVEYAMCHSDFILQNILINENKVTAINDFDNCKCLPRVHDMAEFLVSATILNYKGHVTNLKIPVLLQSDISKLEIVLSYYKKMFDFSMNELILLSIVAEIVWLWTLCLSVLKEDYSLEDIKDVIYTIREHKFANLIKTTYTKLN